MLVRALERGRVDGDGIVEELAERTLDGAVDVGHVEGEVLATATGRGRVGRGGFGVVVGVGPIGVLGQAGGKLEVDADRAGDDAHRVGRERARLVRADDGRVGHRLARTEHAHEQVLRRHPPRRKRQRQRDRQRQTLGHGDDDDRDADDQDLNKVLRLVLRRPVRVGPETDGEPDEEDDKEQETRARTEPGDNLGHPVELELQWGVLRVALQRHHEPTVLRPLADGGDQVAAGTLDNLAAREDEAVGLAALARLAPLLALGVRRLADLVRLARRRRFVRAHVVPGDEHAVDGQDLARLELEDVADNDLVDVEEPLAPAAADRLDVAILLLGVEQAELALLLVVVDTSDHCGWSALLLLSARDALTTIRMATMIARPSTQSTDGSSQRLFGQSGLAINSGSVPRSW